MAPILPHLVNGTVFDLFGNKLTNATVTLTHAISPVLSATTGSDGKYVINLSGLSSQWSKGDSISLKGSKTAEGRKTVTTTIQGTGSQTVDITLEETSDFDFDEPPQDRTILNQVIPLHYDGEKITRTRRFPVDAIIVDSNGNRVKVTRTRENLAGSAGSGNDGDSTRVFTLTTTNSVDIVEVYLDGVLLVESTQYTINNSTKKVTMVSTAVFDSQIITIFYNV